MLLCVVIFYLFIYCFFEKPERSNILILEYDILTFLSTLMPYLTL